MYFVKLITQALSQPDPRKALLEAFRTIETLGEAPDYKEDYNQFQRFMDVAVRHLESQPHLRADGVRQFLLAWLTGAIDEDGQGEAPLFSQAVCHPQWRDTWEILLGRRPEEERLELLLARENKTVCRLTLTEAEDSVSVSRMTPGRYELKTDTGWELWSEELTEEMLLLTTDMPQPRPLQLAAETETSLRTPTHEAILLCGEIRIRVFAGLEWGAIEIARRRKGEP